MKDILFSLFLPAEKSMSEVLDNPVSLWEESRVEDELSPEEIQMVRPNHPRVIQHMRTTVGFRSCTAIFRELSKCTKDRHTFIASLSCLNQVIATWQTPAMKMCHCCVFPSSLSRRTRGWWVRWTAWWMKWGESNSEHFIFFPKSVLMDTFVTRGCQSFHSVYTSILLPW